MNQRYHFVSHWEIPYPLEKVWTELLHIERWPSWWKDICYVEIATLNIANNGIGTTVHTRWQNWMPYTLEFTLIITEVVPGKKLAAKAIGDLAGRGLWLVEDKGNACHLTYIWDVATTKPWMNFVAPIGKPIFKHAHNLLMLRGKRGLIRLLEQSSSTPTQLS
jgi:hypothetical protein